MSVLSDVLGGHVHIHACVFRLLFKEIRRKKGIILVENTRCVKKGTLLDELE